MVCLLIYVGTYENVCFLRLDGLDFSLTSQGQYLVLRVAFVVNLKAAS